MKKQEKNERSQKSVSKPDEMLDKRALRHSWRYLVNYLGTSLPKSFTSLMEAVPCSPKEDLLSICECWMDLTGAQWIWLWMLLPDLPGESAGWQIQSTWPPKGRFQPKPLKVKPTSRAVVHWCIEKDRAEFVSNMKGWVRRTKTNEYRVLRADEILDHGGQSFLCIPLMFPSHGAVRKRLSQQNSPIAGIVRGAMCIHFDRHNPKIAFLPQPMLMVMAKATTLAIVNSVGASQRRILNELDLLATRFMTRVDLRAERQRLLYLGEVIKLMRKQLNVEFVTFFYRTSEGSEIECIATTGLEQVVPTSRGRRGMRLAKKDLYLARYTKGQGVTGRVFESGEPFICQADRPARPSTESCSWRETPCTILEDSRSWVVWPIKTPVAKAKGADPSNSVLGIIRCVDNRQPDNQNAVRAFDPVQLETLNFIAAQLAPILAAMAVSIERERMINFIKHDLITPMLPVQSHIEDLKLHFRGKRKIPRSAVSSLKSAVFMEQNLAQSLTAPRNFQPSQVNLHHDVIAPMRNGISHFAWEEKRMKIIYTNFGKIPWLHVDRDLVARALTNVLTNAIKYGEKGSTIRVNARSNATNYLIEVINDGIGVARRDQKRIFLGTYRAKEAQELAFGAGNGLKIARAIMRRHRGDLHLHRRTKPTIFTLLFSKDLAC
ncbi:MAG: ATP-binding protein [Chthoniobacteraceae bacterium]